MRSIFSYAPLSCLLLLLCFGCKTAGTVTVPKDQVFYANSYPPTTSPGEQQKRVLTAYTSDNSFKAALSEKGDGLFFKQSSGQAAGIRSLGSLEQPTSSNYQQLVSEDKLLSQAEQNKYYFSTSEQGYSLQASAPAGSSEFIKNHGSKFVYAQHGFYLQAMAIPIRYRRPFDNVRGRVEAGPSFAIAPGVKYSWNQFNGTKNALGRTTTAYSAAIGGLLGLGLVDLNASSTQGRVLDANATKNIIIPIGIHLVGGLNNINLGVAAGIDVVTGPNSGEWNYKGKVWTGLLVGLDILK